MRQSRPRPRPDPGLYRGLVAAFIIASPYLVALIVLLWAGRRR